MGDPNASIPTAAADALPPDVRRATPALIEDTCLTFVSGASLGQRHHAASWACERRVEAVRNTRRLSKRDMVRNDALPRIEVNPETYEVRVDGELATVPPAQTLPLAQKYFMV